MDQDVEKPDDKIGSLSGPPPDKGRRQRIFDSLAVITNGHQFQYADRSATLCDADHDGGTFLYSWGAGCHGQLRCKPERGSCKNLLIPGLVNVPEPVRQVASGGSHTACCTDAGHVFVWGDGRQHQLGLVGDGHTYQSTPLLLSALVHAKAFIMQVACGSAHTVALTDDGRVWTWGISKNGQTGHGDRIPVRAPKKMESDVKFTWVSTGDRHTAALSVSGHVYTCGHGEHGQLGHGSSSDELRLKLVSDLAKANIVRVECGSIISAAVDQNGAVYFWGFGELIFAPDTHFAYKPIVCHLKEKIVDVSCGHSHVMALSETGNVWVWGSNEFSQIGNGDTRNTRIPQIVLDGKDIASINAGRHHCATISRLGLVYTWGCGEDGQLGHNNLCNSSIPRLVQSLLGHVVGQIACADRHTIALTAPYRNVSEDILQVYHAETQERRIKLKALQALRDGTTQSVAERAQVAKFLHKHNAPGENHLRLRTLMRLLPGRTSTHFSTKVGSKPGKRLSVADASVDRKSQCSQPSLELTERKLDAAENLIGGRLGETALAQYQPPAEGVVRIAFHREISTPLKQILRELKNSGIGASEAKAEYRRLSDATFFVRKEFDRVRHKRDELIRQYQLLEFEKELVSDRNKIHQQQDLVLGKKFDDIRIQLDTVTIKTNETLNTRKRYEQSITQLREGINDTQRRITSAYQLENWHDIGLAKIQQTQTRIGSDPVLADVKIFSSETQKFNRFLKDHVNKFKAICEFIQQERKSSTEGIDRNGEHRKSIHSQRINSLLVSIKNKETKISNLEQSIDAVAEKRRWLENQFEMIAAITGSRDSKEIITRFYARKEIEADLLIQQKVALNTIEKLKREHAFEIEKIERAQNTAQIRIQALEHLQERSRIAHKRREEVIDLFNTLVMRRAQMHEFFLMLLKRLNSALGRTLPEFDSLAKLLVELQEILDQCTHNEQMRS